MLLPDADPPLLPLPVVLVPDVADDISKAIPVIFKSDSHIQDGIQGLEC